MTKAERDRQHWRLIDDTTEQLMEVAGLTYNEALDVALRVLGMTPSEGA